MIFTSCVSNPIFFENNDTWFEFTDALYILIIDFILKAHNHMTSTYPIHCLSINVNLTCGLIKDTIFEHDFIQNIFLTSL